MTPDPASESNKPLFEPETKVLIKTLGSARQSLELPWEGPYQISLTSYTGLLLLTPKVLSPLFDPQDNAFLFWAHSYATLHNWSNCWVCGTLPSSIEGFTWCVSPLQGKDFPQLGQYLHQQQLYVMPLFNLMTSNNPKMDWYNTLYLNYGHNVTFNFGYVLTGLMTILAYIYNCKMGFVFNHLKAFRLQMMVQAPMSATTFSNCYLGPLDQRPSIWGWAEYVLQQFRDDTPQKQEVVTELKWCPFSLATYSKRKKRGMSQFLGRLIRSPGSLRRRKRSGALEEEMLLLLLSHFNRVRLCVTPQTAAHQALPSLGFSRQEHWSGLPLPSPLCESEKWKWSHSVASHSSRPHGLQPTRLLHLWDFLGKSTGVACHCLLRRKRQGSGILKEEKRTNIFFYIP